MSKITYATSEDISNLSGGTGMSEADKNKLDGMVIKTYSVSTTDWKNDTYNGSQVYSYNLLHNLGTSNVGITWIDVDTGMNLGQSNYQVVNSNTVKLYTLEKLNAKFIITASK